MKFNRILSFALLLSILTAAKTAAEPSGPLRVSPENPRYFADASGQPVLLVGAHTWSNLIDMGPADPPLAFNFDDYLARLKQHGHNFIRGWAWEATQWTPAEREHPGSAGIVVTPQPWERTGPGLAHDGKPKFDLERVNPEYLERIKSRVAKAAQQDMYISVMLFEGYCMQFRQETWPCHPFHPDNNINGIDGDPNKDGKGLEVHQLVLDRVTKLQEAYVREVVKALDGFANVLYEIANEALPDSTEWQYHMIRFIKACEKDLPKQHPVGMTYQNAGGKNETLFNSPADWISPNHDGGYRDNPPDAAGRKVILTDTDHLWGIGGNAVWVWKSFTRGLNPIFMDPYDGSLIGQDKPPFEALRDAMGHVLAYSRRMNLARATPSNSLASTGFCLADPGESYLVLAPKGGGFEVDLTANRLPFSAEWCNPENGTVREAEDVRGGDMRTFTPPFEGPAVLFLKAQTPNER